MMVLVGPVCAPSVDLLPHRQVGLPRHAHPKDERAPPVPTQA